MDLHWVDARGPVNRGGTGVNGPTSFVPDPSWPTIVELATELWGQPTERRHDDIRFGSRCSKSVKPSTNVWCDYEANEGGGYIALWLLARQGQPLPSARTNGQTPPWQNIDVAYDYHYADASLAYQVVRTITGEPRFLQRRPNGPDRWIWNLKETKRVLYHLPDLIAAAPGSVVYIAEGEKDVDRLRQHGRLATCNPGGAAEHKNKAKPYRGKWLAEFSQYLRGHHVRILPDNDAPGEAHALDIANKLHGIAASVRIVRLPDLPPKGDVSDWLNAGHTIEELDSVVDETPDYQPPDKRKPPQPDDDTALPVAFSENALAYQFTAEHAETLLYCHGLGWLRWDKGRWRDDHAVAVYDAARRICAQAGEVAIAKEPKGTKIARDINKAACVAAIERLARHHHRHARSSEDFDANQWLLNGPTRAQNLKMD
jgi:putative DNA primase/helicase